MHCHAARQMSFSSIKVPTFFINCDGLFGIQRQYKTSTPKVSLTYLELQPTQNASEPFLDADDGREQEPRFAALRELESSNKRAERRHEKTNKESMSRVYLKVKQNAPGQQGNTSGMKSAYS